MSGIVIEDEAWRRIFADDDLRRARSRLSLHEIRLIVRHVRDSDGSPKGGDGEAGSVHDSAGPQGIAP
jgi:hypothetical protein